MNRRARRTLAATVALFGAAVLTACGSSTSGEADADAPVTTTTAPGERLPDGAEALAGRYAHFDVVAYEDASMKTLIISTGFSDLTLRAGVMWNQMTFCHADTVVDLPIDVSISDAATQAIKPIATPVEITEVGGTLHVSRPATPTGIGITFDDPTNDELPTDPNDPRIIDADGDGHPGVTTTVKVSEDLQGEIYLARREIFAYEVTQQSPDRLEGAITDNSEQLILGASDPAFLTPAQWTQLDDPQRNPVIWQRVDGDLDCAGLAAQRNELFPPNPKADW